MKPNVCNGLPEINGQCLDDVIYDIALSLHNMEYPTWEQGFLRHGGDKRMARHLWDKWKSEHHDDFFGAYGNISSQYRRQIIATVVDDIKDRKFKEKWDWEHDK